MLQHKGTKTIKTSRLILRKYQADDAEAMFKNYASDERVARFLSWQTYKSIAQVSQFLAEKPKLYENNAFYDWAITLNGEVIGGISAYNISEKNHSCEIGYCLGHDFWNKGLTSEALHGVINFLFHEVQMHRITATHDVENPASGKVMQKCGMTCEGRFREHYLRHDNSFSDAFFYAILKDDHSSH
jgi:ribosomal-protein-alanine N-acetyltransferase